MVKQVAAAGTSTFQGQHHEEHVQFFFRQHWIRLFVPFLEMAVESALVLTVGALLFTQVTEQDPHVRHFLLLLLIAFFLLIHFEFLLHFYRYFLYVIVITDKKIHRIKKTLFAFDDHQSVDLWMLQDIHKSQHGLVQNVLGFGTITLEAQDTKLRLHFIPSIRQKYETLMHLREQARAQMTYASLLTPGAHGEG